MNFEVSINVMPRAEISDPQGQAVERALPGLGLGSINGVRIGKRITLHIEAADNETAVDVVDRACKKILANPVIEDFSYEISEAAGRPAIVGGGNA